MIRILFFVVLLLPSICFATPAINSVSTATHGQYITITGSGFGTKDPPAPLWWDDMEGHTVNVHSAATFGVGDLPGVISSLPTGSKHYTGARPTTQTYAVPEAYIMFRSAGWDSALTGGTTGNGVAAPHTRSTKYATGCHYEFNDDDYAPADGAPTEPRFRDDGAGYDNVGLALDIQTPTSTFVSYWYYRLDPAMFNEADAGGDNIRFNGKFLNLEQGYEAYPSGWYAGGSFDYRSWEIRPEEQSAGNTVTMNSGFCTGGTFNYMTNPRFAWTHITHIGDAATNIEHFYEGGQFKAGGSCNSGDMYGYYWGGFHGACNDTTHPGCTPLNSTWFGCKDCYRYFDDLYLDNTFSRVELCNSANHASATICEPQIPSAWSDTSITAKANLGALTGSTAYLFVFDSDNAVNATGVAVTIDGSVSPVVPRTVTGVTISGGGVR